MRIRCHSTTTIGTKNTENHRRYKHNTANNAYQFALHVGREIHHNPRHGADYFPLWVLQQVNQQLWSVSVQQRSADALDAGQIAQHTRWLELDLCS